MLESAVKQGKAGAADVRAVAEQVVWHVKRKAHVAQLELPAGPKWSPEGAAGAWRVAWAEGGGSTPAAAGSECAQAANHVGCYGSL